MSRIRSIKPEFFVSAQIIECSPNARLLFIGLWCFCDDLGRHPASARQAKAEVFPTDDGISAADVQLMLDELSKNDLIRFYEVEDKRFFYVTGWHHQRIDKPQKPKYPDPFAEHSTNVRGAFPPDPIRSDPIGDDSIGSEIQNKSIPDTQPTQVVVPPAEAAVADNALAATPVLLALMKRKSLRRAS